MGMALAIALLLAGLILLVVASFYLAAQRALGSPPNFAPPRTRASREPIHGCMTCALAVSGGDGCLERHIARDHRA